MQKIRATFHAICNIFSEIATIWRTPEVPAGTQYTQAPYKIYIIGKVTGLPPAEVEQKFAKAEQFLRQTNPNCTVINPVKLVGNPAANWVDAMKLCITELLKCQAVWVLPCAEDSNGANLELLLVNKLNIKVLSSHSPINFAKGLHLFFEACTYQTKKAAVHLICEYAQAKEKHPNWPTDVIHQAGIVAEEAGELLREAINVVYEAGGPHYKKEQQENLVKEATQTGAMALRFLSNLPHFKEA